MTCGACIPNQYQHLYHITCRCNFNAEQRRDFVALAGRLQCPVHALVFQLPVDVCVARASQRLDHEGGVEGPGASRVVKMMHGQIIKAGVPRLSEGLASVMVACSDADVQCALDAWCGSSSDAAVVAEVWRNGRSRASGCYDAVCNQLVSTAKPRVAVHAGLQHSHSKQPNSTTTAAAAVNTSPAVGVQSSVQHIAKRPRLQLPLLHDTPSSSMHPAVHGPKVQRDTVSPVRNAFAVLMRSAPAQALQQQSQPPFADQQQYPAAVAAGVGPTASSVALLGQSQGQRRHIGQQSTPARQTASKHGGNLAASWAQELYHVAMDPDR